MDHDFTIQSQRYHFNVETVFIKYRWITQNVFLILWQVAGFKPIFCAGKVSVSDKNAYVPYMQVFEPSNAKPLYV